MVNNATSIETFFEKVEQFSETTIKLVKLKTIDKSADVVSSLIMRLTILIVIAMFTLIVTIGVALLISELIGNLYSGFFIIGGFYALVIITLYIFRYKWIKNPLNNSIISQILKNGSNEEA